MHKNYHTKLHVSYIFLIFFKNNRGWDCYKCANNEYIVPIENISTCRMNQKILKMENIKVLASKTNRKLNFLF